MSDKLRKTAKKLRKQAEAETTVKCAQVLTSMSALQLLKRRLNNQEM